VKYISELYFHNFLLISIISVIADFLTFYIIFIILFFIDYRKKYFNAVNSEVKQKFKKDILKLLTTLGLSEIGYLSAKFLSIYYIFATLNIDSSQISILSTIIAWIVYIIIANLLIKKYQIL
jgi:hypothetical protein